MLEPVSELCFQLTGAQLASFRLVRKQIVGGLVAAMAWPGVASAWEFPDKVRPRSRFRGATAHAPSTREVVSEPTTPTDWYGWQIIAADATAISLVLIGAGEEGDAGPVLVAAGFGVFLLGAPFLHVANGEEENSAGSVALRMGAPVSGFLLGGFIGAGSGGDNDLGAALTGLVIGFTAGVATAMTVDAAFIAKKDAKMEHPEAAKVSVAPSVAVTPKGAFTGLAGTF